ncbi:permease prefix domain 1-containing protein [Alkalicoccobacillus murimartini]|uniref:DUF1700 domain-containing protein n=1 Tax=Alkalicoccobacillus murimartini TaxID=171685 RepID=A0ABT9YK94_9BACI|nr:permease prefix domain 1-containing protein [Alkalicoccobacillus murimartini]MDQ0207915.1 hypothetical protein [Alkalicoccobacillus murimartini]
MNHDLESYVQAIVKQTDCTKDDYEDLYEELLDHVKMIRDEHIERGDTLREATEKAKKQFGDEATIGNDLQHSMFPFRRELLYVLAIAGFLFTVGLYVYFLATEQLTLPFELGLGVVSHSLILFFAMNTTYRVNRRRWLNTALIFHLAVLVYNSYGPINLFYDGQYLLPMLLIGIACLNIGIIFLTALTGPGVGRTVFIHLINIPIGLVLSAKAIILGFGGLIFGASFLYLIGMAFPVYIWIGLYVIQYISIKKNRMLSVSIALCLSIILVLYSVFSFFYIELSFEVRIAHFLNDLLTER